MTVVQIRTLCHLEDFFPKIKSKLITLDAKEPTELRWSAVENCNLSLFLVQQLLKHLVPVWPACVRSCL